MIEERKPDFACRCGREFRIEEVSESRRRWLTYAWNAGIVSDSTKPARFRICGRNFLFHVLRPQMIIWYKVGTADMVYRSLPEDLRAQFKFGGFMRIRQPGRSRWETVEAELERWDRVKGYREFTHINWNPEAPAWEPGYGEVTARVRNDRPDVKFIVGNVGWGRGYCSAETVEHIRQYGDAVECYYRSFGWCRDVRDYLWLTAWLETAFGRKAVYVCAQPWYDGKDGRPSYLISPAAYDLAADIIEQRADGMGMWGWNRLAGCYTRDVERHAVERIALRFHTSRPRPAREPVVAIRLTGNCYYDAAMFRVVSWWAGVPAKARLDWQLCELPVIEASDVLGLGTFNYIQAWKDGKIPREAVVRHEEELARCWLDREGRGGWLHEEPREYDEEFEASLAPIRIAN